MPQANQTNAQAWSGASEVIGKMIQTTLKNLKAEVSQRTYRASNELRSSALQVLRGKRTGKMYRVPTTGRSDTKKGKKIKGSGVMYRASAPGEPPAVRTGVFRLSWGTNVRVEKTGAHFKAVAAIESRVRANGHLLGELLENGHGNVAPRPYKQRVIDRALPKIKDIYKKPYKVI